MAVLAGLGKRIKYCRKKMGYNQKEFAAILKVASNKISRIESEEIGPNFELLIKIADTFGCSTDYLLGREGAADKGPAIKQIVVCCGGVYGEIYLFHTGCQW